MDLMNLYVQTVGKIMSNTYEPDRWGIIEMSEEGKLVYKLMACWNGGYTEGDYWRLNSGIVKIEETEHQYNIYGDSGSLYIVHKLDYGINNMEALDVIERFNNVTGYSATILDCETNFMGIDYTQRRVSL